MTVRFFVVISWTSRLHNLAFIWRARSLFGRRDGGTPCLGMGFLQAFCSRSQILQPLHFINQTQGRALRQHQRIKRTQDAETPGRGKPAQHYVGSWRGERAFRRDSQVNHSMRDALPLHLVVSHAVAGDERDLHAVNHVRCSASHGLVVELGKGRQHTQHVRWEAFELKCVLAVDLCQDIQGQLTEEEAAIRLLDP